MIIREAKCVDCGDRRGKNGFYLVPQGSVCGDCLRRRIDDPAVSNADCKSPGVRS